MSQRAKEALCDTSLCDTPHRLVKHPQPGAGSVLWDHLVLSPSKPVESPTNRKLKPSVVAVGWKHRELRSIAYERWPASNAQDLNLSRAWQVISTKTMSPTISLCLTVCLQKAYLLLHLYFITFFVKGLPLFSIDFFVMQDWCLICCFLKPFVVLSWGEWCPGLDANCCGDLLIQSKPQSWSFSPHFDGIKSTMNSSKPLQGQVACDHICLRVFLHCVTRCLTCCTQGIFILVLLLFYEALHSCGLHDWRFLKCQPLCKPQ